MARGPSGDWARRYPPLAGSLIAVVVAVLVLPSALNVPQSNPTQTLEFAPVPPEDDAPPPPDSGNVESLSLGSSSTAPAGDASGDGPGLPPPPPPPPGLGTRPVTKRCVGNPPRQSEDPLSPPCVAHFEGDNGGATYSGVTADEVVIVVYMDDIGIATSSRGSENAPPHGLVDLAVPPEGEEFVKNRVLRAAQTYFNHRFQTYNRFVHFYAYYGRPDATPETRRAEAEQLIAELDPFAVVSYPERYAKEYATALARSGVVNFMGRDIYNYEGRAGYTEDLYRQFPGLIWSFDPSINQRAELFSSYVCSKVVPFPVSFSGNPGENGQPRSLAFLANQAPEFSEVTQYAQLIHEGLDDCGAVFTRELGFNSSGKAVCGENYQNAASNMAQLRQDGITTIVWGGGIDVCQSTAAGAVQYRPEWVIPGDTVMDANIYARTHEPSVHQFARTVSSYPRGGQLEDSQCFEAAREGDPAMPVADTRFFCGHYADLRQLFTGIQVAGPRLSPEAMNLGFHAIPRLPSDEPAHEACFYLTDDYSCVKDAQVSWWDPAARPPGRSEAGCWRLMEDGQRYLAGQWPQGDVEEQRDIANDPCNNLNGVELS